MTNYPHKAKRQTAEYLIGACEHELLRDEDFEFSARGLCEHYTTQGRATATSRFEAAIRVFFMNCDRDSQREIIGEASFDDPLGFLQDLWPAIANYLQPQIEDEIAREVRELLGEGCHA